MTMVMGNDDNNINGDGTMGNQVGDDGASATGDDKDDDDDDDGDGDSAMGCGRWDMTTTRMATGNDDNNVNSDGTTGNKVGDDGDGARGDDNDGDDNDDGYGDGAMGSGATG